MSDIAIETLALSLVLLVFLSACFSAAETAMMRINHYRLRHLVKEGHRGALRVNSLLARPDRLIGIILLGNNFANILASSITTIIALRYFGEAWIAIAAGILTLIILVFAEVAPKTMAAAYPERVAYPAAIVLVPMLWIFYPAVWVINLIANTLLSTVGIKPLNNDMQKLSGDELRSVVNEAGSLVPQRHQNMLLNILDLEKVTVDDIMIPRNEIVGVDLENDLNEIVASLTRCQFSYIPLYRGDINNIIGMIHTRQLLSLMVNEDLDEDSLIKSADQPYFVPEGTPLNTQLLKFQRQKRRVALVVDEYGEIEGLVALEDILEEIVGEFTANYIDTISEIHPQKDGSYLVDGGVNIRELNRTMKWSLPLNGPKTLNGLILDALESIPEGAASVRIHDYVVEIVQSADNGVKVARIVPPAVNKLPAASE